MHHPRTLTRFAHAALVLSLLFAIVACGDDAADTDNSASTNGATASTNNATTTGTTNNGATSTNSGTTSDEPDVEAIRAACEAATEPEQCSEAAAGTAYCNKLGDVYRLDAAGECVLVTPSSPCTFIPLPLNGAMIVGYYREAEDAPGGTFEATAMGGPIADPGEWRACDGTQAEPVCDCLP